jgi:Ser-tRNA(Ala) deacylase AlaX
MDIQAAVAALKQWLKYVEEMEGLTPDEDFAGVLIDAARRYDVIRRHTHLVVLSHISGWARNAEELDDLTGDFLSSNDPLHLVVEATDA